MTTATLDPVEVETLTCEYCDGECNTLTESPMFTGQMVCVTCYREQADEIEAEAAAAAEEAKQEAIDEAQGEVDEAEADLEGLMEELAELRERIAEAKKAAAAARRKLARAQA